MNLSASIVNTIIVGINKSIVITLAFYCVLNRGRLGLNTTFFFFKV